MKRLILVLGLVALGAAPVRARDSEEKAVLAALETWRQAVLKKDAAAFDKVFHPDLRYGHSIGLLENKTQATDHVLKSTTIYKTVDLSDTKVDVRGEVALVTGKVHYEKHPKGKPVLHQHLVVLSVWTKTPKGWQMIARQSTEPNPTPQVAQAK